LIELGVTNEYNHLMDYRDELVLQIKQLKQLGYCRAVVANKMGVPERTLDNWMLPKKSKQHRRCPKIAVNMAQCLIDRLE